MAYGITNRKRRELTDKEITLLEGYAAIRLPLHRIAALFNVSSDYLDDMIKRNESARHALELGRSKSEAKFRQTLYQKAIDGDVQAMKFWAYTQLEGFNTPYEEKGLHPKAVERLNTIDMKAIEYVPEDELNRKLELLMAKA